jgi:hypothetical protein
MCCFRIFFIYAGKELTFSEEFVVIADLRLLCHISGGYVVIAASHDLVRASGNYKELETLMGKLETEGKWQKVVRETWLAESVENKTVERIAWCYKVL